ncbi:hypothetical protein Celaphus_00017545 [Cervus elaphus hippelaphus]|uniref:Uncharacterized protein n=1 Tax=Cervus elaphus hippelaphus TaxID=46360 RepID=A0A212C6E6_CEREH|nr:hypothetical protein Celaphus_00017545 [Cervus elaphus hippelaphus]
MASVSTARKPRVSTKRAESMDRPSPCGSDSTLQTELTHHSSQIIAQQSHHLSTHCCSCDDSVIIATTRIAGTTPSSKPNSKAEPEFAFCS